MFDEQDRILRSAGKKSASRKITETAIRSGFIKKDPCLHCGDINVQAHHSDYGLPLEVVWLCSTCHMKYHSKLKAYLYKNQPADEMVIIQTESLDLKTAIRELERKFISFALERVSASVPKAAKMLGISHPTLLYKMKSYNLSPNLIRSHRSRKRGTGSIPPSQNDGADIEP